MPPRSRPDRRKNLLTVVEVASRLQLTAESVYDLIRDGDLPAINVAKLSAARPLYRIDPQILDDWLTAREHS